MNLQKVISLAVACAVTAGSLTVATQASAQQNERFTVTGPRFGDAPIERVSYRDLNLAMARDQDRLMKRVGFAVNQLCPGIAYLGDPRCRSSAWDGAKPQIALAVDRAKQIARNGFSTIAPVAIVLSVAQ
jgi:UrcA family protein